MPIESAPAAVIIFLVTIGMSLYTMYKDQSLFERMALHPFSVVEENRWHTMVTSGFVHADIPHLAFNMLTFYFFAFSLEMIIGTVNFIILYFASLILSDISTVVKQRHNPHYRSVGASGAISGVLFSFILFAPFTKIMLFFIPIGIPAPIFGALYLAYCYFAARRGEDFVNHDAHFWGALAGIVVTIILEPQVVPHFLGIVF
jgi:membrane associated rhomboid family serine protease